jgi:hypothetical protein
MSLPSIIYACVVSLRNEKILTEAGSDDTVESTLKAFIKGIPQEPREKASFTHGPYGYTFLKDEEYAFVAISPTSIESRIVFYFLEEMEREFYNGGDRSTYKTRVESLMVKHTHPRDLIEKMNDDLDETKRQLESELGSLFSRGKSLEELEDDANSLEMHTGESGGLTHNVKNIVWWKRMKFRVCCCLSSSLTTLIVIIILIVVLLVVLKHV